jgi:hypothetical protein
VSSRYLAHFLEEAGHQQDFTADAILQASVTSSFTANAVISTSQSGSFTADAIITSLQTGSFTADAVLQAGQSSSFTADAFVQAASAASFTADAIISVDQSASLSADAVLQTAMVVSLTADAIIQAAPSASLTADAVVETARSSSFSADAVIGSTAIPNPFPYTGIPGSPIARPGNIVPGAFDHPLANATFTADAVITVAQTSSFTANAVISVAQSGSFTADAEIASGLTTVTQTFTADALVAITPTATISADAVIQASRSQTFSADSILQRVQSASFTADAAFSVHFTADAIIEASQSLSFLADAQIVAPPDEVYGAVPDGYEPLLAAPIDDTQTTITVTNPLPEGTELPILVYIDGEWMLVTAVSLDGLTWTVVRGFNTSTATSHGISRVLPANTTISVGGVQIGADVNFTKTRLETYSNGKPGTGEIWIRDLDRSRSFTTGAEVIVRHRNIRVWGGFITGIRRAHVFPEGSGNLATEPRYLILQVMDYNILFERRIYYRKVNPPFMPVRRWPNGTHDDVVIGDLVTLYLDIGDDHLNFDVNHVGTPGLPQISCNPDAPDNFQIGSAGWRWGDVMNAIISQTGAVYYIDPDRTLRYVDDSTKQSVFGYTGLSDDPSGTVTGYRNFELVHDGSELVNEQFTWGVGQGATAPVLGHATDATSIAAHGLWQGAELRYDMYCQDTVDLRAQTWLDGSPQNRRGHKRDRISVRATVFHPYFRVADVLNVESTTYGFNDDIPVRGAAITFPTPWNIQMDLTISHELDQPWNIFEFYFPDFDFGFPPFGFPPFDGFGVLPPHDPCEDDASCIETYTRTSLLGNGLGVDEIWGLTWPASTVYETDGDEAKFHKSVACSAGSGGFTPPIALSDLLITSPLEYLFLIRGDREFERVLGNTLSFARWQFLLSAQANPGVEFAPYNADHYGVDLTWGTQASVAGPDICTDPGGGDRLTLGFKVFPGAVPAASVTFDDAADITIQEPMWLRFRMDEDGLHARLWQFGEVEPGVWSTELAGDFSGLPMLYQWYQYSGVRDQNFYVSSYEIVEPCPVIGPCVDAAPGEFEEPPDEGTLYGMFPQSSDELDNGNFLYCFGIQFQINSSEVWADGYRLRLGDDYIEHAENGCIEILSTTEAGTTPFDPGMSITANLTPWIIQDPPPVYEP